MKQPSMQLAQLSVADTHLTIEHLCSDRHQLAGVGAALWPTSLTLSCYLVRTHSRTALENMRVLELGSGTGLLGLVLAKHGADVTFTDGSFATEAMHMLRMNVQRNLCWSADKVESRVCAFDWGDTLPASLQAPYEVVVAADVAYETSAIANLLLAIKAITDANSRVYVGIQEHNMDAVELFCDLAPDHFICRDVEEEELAVHCGDYSRRDIHIIEMRQRQPSERRKPLLMNFSRLSGFFDD